MTRSEQSLKDRIGLEESNLNDKKRFAGAPGATTDAAAGYYVVQCTGDERPKANEH